MNGDPAVPRPLEGTVKQRLAAAFTPGVDEKVRFKTGDGTVVEETITDCGDRQPEPPGTRVQVKYARTNPSAVQFAEPVCRKVSDPAPFIRAGLVVLALSVLLFWSAWRSRSRINARTRSSVG